MDQKPVRMFLGQRLAELLQGPFSARMRRHIEVQDPTPAQFHDHEYIKDTESGCEHHEKVARHDGVGMTVHKGQPSLTRIRRPNSMTSQVLLHCARGNADSELQFQLVGNALLAPGEILSR